MSKSSSGFKKLKQKLITIKDKISGYDKDIILKTFKLPNGMTENFFVNKEKDSVSVIALTKNKELILVEQYRPSLEETFLELPGGGIEDGSDDSRKEAAKRELLEETMHSTDNIVFLHSQNYSLYSLGKKYIYIALDCEKKSSELDLDPNEFLKVKLIPLDKIKETLKDGNVKGWEFIYMFLDRNNLL